MRDATQQFRDAPPQPRDATRQSRDATQQFRDAPQLSRDAPQQFRDATRQSRDATQRERERRARARACGRPCYACSAGGLPSHAACARVLGMQRACSARILRPADQKGKTPNHPLYINCSPLLRQPRTITLQASKSVASPELQQHRFQSVLPCFNALPQSEIRLPCRC